MHFSELNTEPALSLHTASDFRYRFCPWTSLMSCLLNFAHVELSEICHLALEQVPQKDLLHDPFSLMPGQALQKGA
jgi:hypothetical protein